MQLKKDDNNITQKSPVKPKQAQLNPIKPGRVVFFKKPWGFAILDYSKPENNTEQTIKHGVCCVFVFLLIYTKSLLNYIAFRLFYVFKKAMIIVPKKMKEK